MRRNKLIILIFLFALLSINIPGAYSAALSEVFSVKPHDAYAQWKSLIGDYQGKDGKIIVLEEKGKLYILKDGKYQRIEGLKKDYYAVYRKGKPSEAFVRFTRNGEGIADKLIYDDKTYNRIFYGTESGKQFRIKPVKPVEVLRLEAIKAKPPKDKGLFLYPEFVDIEKLDPTIKLDIKYATSDNFMGVPFYTQPKAFMQKPAAQALVRVNKKLKPYGYCLLIYDAYRPWYVTKMFWDATPENQKQFVGNPENGSRHNRGCAVDVTLYDLKKDAPVSMTSGFDEFSSRAYPSYQGGTSLQRWNRWFLNTAMKEEGFTIYPYEWWHFDYKDWRKYPIMNIRFEDIKTK
ncbi:MAG: M15 family metallopeptidase [Armatimonadota bacterium]